MTCSTLGVAAWLLGAWTSADGHVETWTQVSDATFEGRAELRETRESLRLVEMSAGVFYLAKVDENALPVAFRLADCDDASLVFENPAHDFPRRLEYRRTGEDDLTVHVSDGAGRGFTIDFIRMPNGHQGERQ